MAEELEEIEAELATLETEISSLLQRQEDLLERRSQLKILLQSQETSRLGHQRDDWEVEEFTWSSASLVALKDTFRVEKFRPLQASCVNSIMSKRDTILIMPTGGGKSLCYQLPAVLSQGLTLIISPLISLMEDQLLAVRKFGIEACTLNSSSSRETVNKVHAAMTQKDNSMKLLYVTPEKLSKSKRFMSKLEKVYEMGRLAMVVIDEVHCASQWGHDFRTDYKILGILKRQFPSTPILGLTATAPQKVLEDVKEMLSMKDCLVFRAPYNRPNLFYEVRIKRSGHKMQMEDLCALINGKFHAKSGLQNLYTMLKYCLNQSVCRRAIIARCFGEQWKESDCSVSCDICSMYANTPSSTSVATCSGQRSTTSDGSDGGGGGGTRSTFCSASDQNSKGKAILQDITDHCKALVEIIEAEQCKDKRLTALKVIEIWKKQQSKNPLSVETCEQVVLHAIIQEVLKEEFHFTPYSTISYIGLGSKANAVKRKIINITIKRRAGNGIVALPRRLSVLPGGTQQHKSGSTGKEGCVTPPLTDDNKVAKSSSIIVPPRIKLDTATKSVVKSRPMNVVADGGAIKRKLPQMLLSSTSTESMLSKDTLPVKRLKLSRADVTLHNTETKGVIQIDSD